MSLTNPNTPVSQQDLQDFYHKLLPYMGGSFGMIANKFGKGDMYSTDEKMIGQWIDSKPLYQKTVSFGSLPNKNEKIIEHGIANIDRIVHAHALAFNPTTGSGKPLGYVYDNGGGGLASQIGFNVTRTHIGLFNRGDDYSAFDAYVTIQYTKTTDSAISIGDDTDYSTTEKIVGTWIDSKPIYQKTFTGGKTVQNGNVYDCRDLNIDTVVSMDGMFAGSFPLCLYYTSDGSAFFITTSYSSAGYIKTQTVAGWVNLDIKVTLRYTKTTD